MVFHTRLVCFSLPLITHSQPFLVSSRNAGDECCVTALKITARETRPAWHEQMFNRGGPREGSNRPRENAMVPRARKSFVPVTRLEVMCVTSYEKV